MGVFSGRNFVAPFKNTAHLGLIVLVVILFSVFRLSSGSVRSADSTKSLKTPASSPLGTESLGSKSNQPNEDLLREFLQREKSNTQESPEAPPSKDGSLSQIERELGLR